MDRRRESGRAAARMASTPPALPSQAERGSARDVVRRLVCAWYRVWLSASSSWRIWSLDLPSSAMASQ
uniref:Uncharacterized protein n=1 Tax=Arundo donax TaxID=35708 RepID=A0A0A9H0B7_ARUDO